jgi:hypothetical protein
LQRGKDLRALAVEKYMNSGRVRITEHAYRKTVLFKELQMNHLWAQLSGFVMGEPASLEALGQSLRCLRLLRFGREPRRAGGVNRHMALRDNLIRRALSHYLREEWRLWRRSPSPEIQAGLDREWREAISAAEDEAGTMQDLLKAPDAIDRWTELDRQRELMRRFAGEVL